MIAVIGCGNPNRSDDGAGPAVLRLLLAKEAARDGLRLLDAGTDGMAVMFAARGCRSLFVVDACATGSEPGAIFEVPGNELEARHEPALTLHDFRWDHALFAGRKMYGGEFPRDVTILLIEARTTDLGVGLSPEVAEAASRVAARISEAIASRESLDRGGAVSGATVEVSVRRGSLYLSCDVYDRYFAGLNTVVLLRRSADLCVLPVRNAAAGGYLLKRRNAAGDRVVNAADFFYDNGIGDAADAVLPAQWSTDHACLLVRALFDETGT